VIVSHDRHLIKTVADSLWLVADGKLEVFDGDLDDYQQWLRSRGKRDPAAPAAATAARAAAGTVGKVQSQRVPASLSKLRREIAEIEQRIAAIAAQTSEVETALCQDPMHTGLQTQHAALTRDAAAMEVRWMEIGTAIEAAEAEFDRQGKG
jgi:ATP-binding cassette subfamily F protein 3